jgi:selenide,water dikinase
VGGHSVDDPEIKYGLSVTGVVHPEKILKNSGARPGDFLVLTKPLGTGIVSTAVKADMAEDKAVQKSIAAMNTLNRRPVELMENLAAHACTDITGFGFLGHACEMIEESGVGMIIHASRVPVIEEALEYASMGLIPGGCYRNEKFRASLVEAGGSVGDEMMKILFDPQTSGGLLISLPGPDARRLLEMLHEEGITDAAIVGEIVDAHVGKIRVES